MNSIYIISVVVSVIVMISCQVIDAKLNNNGVFSIPLMLILLMCSFVPVFNLFCAAGYILILLVRLIDANRFEINVNNIKFKK